MTRALTSLSCRFLILIIIVVTIGVVIGNIYLVVYYQHPDDNNQAWFPKIVVVLGLSLAFLSVMMLPLDRANRSACAEGIVLSACKLTLPMYDLWYWVYMAMVIIIAFVIPFTMFLYEADGDKCAPRRPRRGLLCLKNAGMGGLSSLDPTGA